jgi:hypothetical protein
VISERILTRAGVIIDGARQVAAKHNASMDHALIAVVVLAALSELHMILRATAHHREDDD